MLVFGLMLAGATAARALTPSTDINSAGPLTDIWIGTDLGCQVAHTGLESDEFFGPQGAPADCGTFLSTGGQLYGPDFANHQESATPFAGESTYTPVTAVSQSGVSGAGTSSSPFRVSTVVGAGTTGLTMTETDSYVVGNEFYRTDVTVTNNGGSPVPIRLYRGADCFLQGSDSGFGLVDPSSHAPACATTPDDSPPGPLEQFAPITPGIHYLETFYASNWQGIDSQADLPDTCDCSTQEDNGASINWDATIAPRTSQTFSMLLNFSTTGKLALTTAKTADAASASPGGSDGYTMTITNPNAAAVTLNTITDTLPAGFTYVPGSSSGATTSDPSVSGQTLTWAGPIGVAGGGGRISLHFRVTAAKTAGTYFNNAGGTSTGFAVTPTGPVAPVTVSGTSTPTAPTATTGTAVVNSPQQASLGATVNPHGSIVTDCHFEWGLSVLYGHSTPCTPSPGNGASAVQVFAQLTGLTPGGSYHFRIVATNVHGTSDGADQTFVAADSPVLTASTPSVSGGKVAFSGKINPEGLPTTAHYEYGLDSRYRFNATGQTPSSAIIYDQSTTPEPVGSDFQQHPFSATAPSPGSPALVPNAVYHVRLVAVNSSGTALGADQVFRTPAGAAPGQAHSSASRSTCSRSPGSCSSSRPTASPIHGSRFSTDAVTKGQGFVPITEARQVPTGSQVDARRGTLKIVTATGNVGKTQTGTFSSGLFKLTQASGRVQKGLTTLSLLEGAFPGAPSFASCQSRGFAADSAGLDPAAGPFAHAARVNFSSLNVVHSRDHHGSFRTRGHYSAGTVQGTVWDTIDKCSGTLTVVHRGKVSVRDFHRHKTILVRAGHSYLAKAFRRRHR